MQLWLVRLTFTGPAHFGEAGVGNETTNVTLRSDSLYSAVWSTWARYTVQPGIEELLAMFGLEDPPVLPPFRLSSAFPFDGATCYLPRPSLPARGLEQHGKTVKQTRYLPLHLFRAWADGTALDPGALQQSNERLGHLHEVMLRPRAQLDRITEGAELYQVGQVAFATGAGLWFLVELADPTLLAPLQQVVALLGEDGLGGRRSAGYGGFTPQWQEVTAAPDWRGLLAGGSVTGPHCLLSLCNPAPAELPDLLVGATYEILERRGWAASRNRAQAPRLPVRMLAEGSVLSGKPRGRVVDVTPPGFAAAAGHPVFRSGLALAVPVTRGDGS